MPPCRHSGERIEPVRARPVPFCFQSFLPEPATSCRVFGLLMPHRLVQQRLVDFGAKHLVGKLQLADFLIIQIHNVHGWHGVYLFARRTTT